ncbi:MAG: hypothetical protein H0Z40_01480 [Desulfotomaculum sp.]|nr:hypothetical protein [Desulfotomaculum sp.]
MSSSKKKQKTTVDKKQEQLIYCGPNLPKGVLNQFAVYRGSLPKHLDVHINACPAIKNLLVPVSKLTKTLQNIKTPGTAEYNWFKQVQKYNEGGAK